MTSDPSVRIRPMRPEDVEELQVISATSFHELDRRTFRRDWPDPQPRAGAAVRSWHRRTAHFLATDPEGCWVAESGDRLVGFATSYTRELMWILAGFNVRSDLQGAGIGVQLLQAALHHGRGCLRGMLAASDDPKALRRYRLAGFTLHPQMLLWGPVPRSAIPVVDHVRDGTTGDRELLESLDRRTRGAARGSDHDVLGELFRLIVLERSSGSGYAYVNDAGRPVLLAATSRRVATDLAWEALAASDPDRPLEVPHVTAANEWMIDVGMAARMQLHTRGYLALRHMRPPAPYLHHGTFL